MKIFKNPDISTPVSSFCLDGECHPIIPQTGDSGISTVKIDSLTAGLKMINYGSGMREICTVLKNESEEKTKQITEFYGLDITFSVIGRLKWESLTGDTCGINSFFPLEREVKDGDSFSLEATNGRSSQGEAFPYFDLTDEENSIVIGVGWTGQWKYTVSRIGDEVRLRIGFTDCDMYLNPGESIRSVSVQIYEGEKGDSLITVRQKFRRMNRELFSPAAARGGHVDVPIALQVFDRYINSRPSWRTEEEQIRCVEIASQMHGVDTYWLDAAWFEKAFPKGVGNYNYEPGLPKGLTAVSEKAHQEGLRFVVWFEPERVYPDTEVHREHRDWLLEVPGNPIFLLDLSRDEVADWLIQKLSEHIRRDGIDIYRQDFNMDPLPFWRARDPEGRKGYTENCYITNLYRVWDSLLKTFPDLMIDNCSSGGRRLDFEMNRRALAMWRSDTGCYPGEGKCYNQNQAIGLSRYLPYHSIATWTADAYDMRAAMSCGLACNFPVLEEGFEPEKYREALDEAVRTCNLWDGDFYPLTPASVAEDVWAAYQLNCEKEGFALFFRRSQSKEAEKVFALQGLDKTGTYQVVISDEGRKKQTFTAAGSKLAAGWKVVIPEKQGSVLLEYSKL